MKKVVSTIAILLYISLMVVPSMAATKVFLLGGQSNMGGAGGPAYAEPPLPSPYDAVQTDVHILGRADNQIWNTWQDLQIGFGQVQNSFGPEVTFGYTLHNTIFPTDDIYLVKYGVGGTHLSSAYNEWNVTINGGAGGAIYQNFMSTVNGALANLAADGLSPTIAGMIWMQGESDTGPNESAEYAVNLLNFTNRVRSDLDAPDMPFVVGRITTHYGTAFNSAQVRTAQMTVPGQVGNASWIDTDDIQQNVTEPYHYGTQGQIDLGIRFANAFSTVPPPPPPPPSLRAVLFDDNFDGGTVGGLPGPAAVGTWALGAGSADAMKVVDAAPSGPVSAPNCLSIVRTAWNQMNAAFERQTNPKDLIRLEMDFYGAQGCMPYVDIWNGTMELNWVMAKGDGGIIVPSGVGAETSTSTVTYNVGAWNHLIMEYSPGAATFDLNVNGNVQAGIPMYQSSSGFDSIGFSCVNNGTDGSGALYDNVKIILNPDYTPMLGDANNDGKVDHADAAALAANWFAAGGWTEGDFNDDGIVNDLDAAILAANWRPSGGNASVSEPTAFFMMILLGPLVLWERVNSCEH